VIASVGSPEKIAAVQALGAETVFCYRETSVAEAVVAARFERLVNEAGAGDIRLLLRTTFPEGAPAANGVGHVELALEGPAGGEPRRHPG